MRKLLSLLTALLFVGTMWGAADYAYSLASGDFSANNHSKTSGGITWTHTHVSGNETWGSFDNTYGFKFGSGNSSYPSAFTLTSSSFSNKIKKVVVTASVNSSKSCKLDVEVGSTTYGSQETINTKKNDTFEFSIADASAVSGVVTLSFSSNTGPLYLNKIEVYYSVDVENLSIKTAPTKLNYKVGEELDLTGLVLTADDKDVTSGYTASPANGATLNSVGAQTVAITYGGKTVNQTIYVGELTGIEITTPPTKTEYNEGQTFDPTGMVVEATFSDKETTPTEWTEEVDDYTYSPTTALQPENTSVTVSYEWAGTEKTANQTITVNAATAYTVTFDAGTGSCATASKTEPAGLAGVELPTATIAISGWSFAGWAEASVTNTEVEPTLYAAGSTYHPTENCTLYAVYKYIKDDGTYKRATNVSEITSAASIVIVKYSSNKIFDTTFEVVDAPTESEGIITAPGNAIFTLTGNNTTGYTLTNGTTTVGSTSTGDSNPISNTTSNSLWIIKAHNTANLFYLENTAKSKLCLDYNNGWMVYAPSSPWSNSYVSLKVYIPNVFMSYNSNPATMINPTVAFTTAGDKNLYVQDEASYTNVANVTGIAKSPVYSSSDETVATVSEAGVVTALKAGSATITAKVEEEVGVNTEAKATYNVTIKDAKTIAGLKALTSTATAKSFTADLTDAVVTYVNGNYAYIQDASGAVYASCGNSLTAGKKINGAVTGSIKASNQIDEITAINLESATVTDGVIPSAAVISAAELAANKADYEGKLVSIENATVTASLTSGSASGGKISDDGKTTEINLYAPASNIEALKDAEGTFNGYISLYSGTTIRFNIYEQSQITLTKNAPTDQTLSFESDAFVLDKPSAEYTAFAGQTVNGAQTTPVYSIEDGDDENGVVTSINSETGVVVLSGNEGIATITVTAPEGETVTAGVTTPWNEATLTYTVQVRNIYDVNLVIKVDGVEVAHGNQATLAGGTDLVKKHADETVALTATRTTGYQFVKWTTSSTDIEIAAADSTKTSGLSATVQGTGTIYANFTAVPELLVSATALNLGYAKLNGSLDAQTFTIEGESLIKGNLTLTLDEAIKDAFTVTPNQIAVNGTLAETTITVTPVTTTAGNFSGNLTISGGGLAEDKTVALTSEIEQTYTVTWSVNGEETSQTDIENTTLTPPTTGTLAGKVFVGWAEAAIDGQTDVEPTFINITKMPAEDKELYAVYASGNPAVEESETISLTSSEEDWVGTGTETYFSEPYGMKQINAKIVNKSIADFENYANTAGEISIGFKCLQNGGTGSRLTISLVDEDGNAIAGTGKEVTPVNTNNKANMTYKDVTYSSSEVQGKNATGYMVQCTTFDKSLLVNGTRYTITIASTLHAYITNAYAVTFEAPENGTLTVKNGENEITSGDMFPKGTLLTVEAEPASGYQLASLTAGGVDIADQKSFSIGTADVEVVATFSQATALDNTELDSKAVKVMRNGILYIEKNGKTYNAQGQLVK